MRSKLPFLPILGSFQLRSGYGVSGSAFPGIRKVFGKNQILYRIAEVATNNPDGTVREVLFSEIGEEVFQRLLEESRRGEISYEVVRSQVIRKKYRHSYRPMMKPVLDVLMFRSNSPA